MYIYIYFVSQRQLFKPQVNDLKEIGEHCTGGIDMYVTSQRLILLDTQVCIFLTKFYNAHTIQNVLFSI